MAGIEAAASSIVSNIQSGTQSVKKSTPAEAQQSFGTMLKNSIEKVNTAQVQSDTLINKLSRGEDVELHDVMIASQEASITLQAALEVRNKAVEAYQEIMRMNI